MKQAPNEVVTKKFLKKELDRQFLDYNTAIQQTLDQMEKRILATVQEMLITFQDQMMGEFKSMHEQFDALLYRHQDHHERLENHELRLVRLETGKTA